MKNTLLPFVIFFIFSFNTVISQTHIWTGGGGSDLEWSNPSNWDVLTIPNTSSNVLIPAGFFPEIVNQTAFASTVLIQSTAALRVKNNFTFSGEISIEPGAIINFEKGFMSGGGTIVNDGTFHFTSIETKDIGDLIIDNNNIVFVEDSGVVHFHNTVVINNNFGAEINILSNGGFLENTSDDVTLNNFGTVKKLPFTNGAFGNFYLIFDINNYGVMDVGENQTFLTLVGSQNFDNTEDGILSGTGTFDITATFTNMGKIRPGNENTSGALKMLNNANLLSPGILEVNINGPSENDIVEIFGTPNLQGDIGVTLSYSPELNDEFTILTASNGIASCNFPAQVSAVFGAFDIYTFDVICNQNSIVLKVESILLSTENFSLSSSDFYVYPNPVKEVASIYFKISETDFSSEELSVSVYNMLGQEVKVINNFSEEYNSFYKGNLASGIYFLHLKNNEKLLAISKMVVN